MRDREKGVSIGEKIREKYDQCSSFLTVGSTLQHRTKLRMPWLEPCMVDGLGDGAYNKSHHDGLGNEKVFPSVLEEPDKPELSHTPDGLHCCSLS